MNQSVLINQQEITLDAADLIQSGGEGMVFKHQEKAIKLYHAPSAVHAAKLRAFCRRRWHLPPTVLAPEAMVMNRRGEIIGLQLPLLPPGSLPLRKLSSLPFRRQARIGQTAVIFLLQQLHSQLTALHQQGLIIGDLNDTNLFFHQQSGQPLTPYWIDVDSWQFADYPCPVAMESFLDPALYDVKEFNRRPVFSRRTDWYAFSVLAMKTLLGMHPYGGTHHQHKTVPARALAGISVLQPEVTRPPHHLPPECLSDELLHHFSRIFDRGAREPLPMQLLQQYAGALTECGQCGLAFPRRRRVCPRCRQQAAAAGAPAAGRPLLTLTGALVHLAVTAHGRFQLITFADGTYTLIRAGLGGRISETVLFNGRPGYRFATFADHLAVNPPLSSQLLLLDLRGSQPARLQMLSTARFQDEAVFAGTPQALYRIAGRWIMRGIVRDGLYIEDPIATAHKAQTRFWAAPDADLIAGYHRVFTRNYFFSLDGRGNETPFILPTTGDEGVLRTAVVSPSKRRVRISVEYKKEGTIRTETCTFNGDGVWRQTSSGMEEESGYWHPQGRLLLRDGGIWLQNSG